MKLRNLTIGAAALGFAMTAVAWTAPTRAMPVSSPAPAAEASDIAEVRYQSSQHPRRGAYSYRSEKSRMAPGKTRSGRSIGKQKGYKHTKSWRQMQGRSVEAPRGVAPYSDIPQKRMRSGGGRKPAPRGSQQLQQGGATL